MEKIVKSQIEAFYFGKFEAAPFDKKKMLKPPIRCQEGNFR
jgi:hypothetical protein